MILDLEDLRHLSGCKRSEDVKHWLRENGVPFMVQRSGHPVTTLDAINRALYGNKKTNEPDWSEPPPQRRTWLKKKRPTNPSELT